ncbi:hypothetical protein PG993_007054 [Apiospora rasikravindrae]|uniref:Uncharacterized protein n=1 Tax=Apiospora rasikravindrae TaxID=990691 RepID=A0ABR1SYN1_9PEZI
MYASRSMSDLTRRIACKSGRATDDVHPCHSELESAIYLSVSQSLQTRAHTSSEDSSGSDAGNPQQAFSDSSSERLTTLSSTAKIGIGIGGLFLVMAAIIAAYLIGKRSQRKRADEEAVKLAQERERDHFAQASSSSREGPKWPPLVQAAELPPPGYDTGTVYDGSGNESAHNHNQQQFGNTNEHGVHEIGPSGQGPVELASSESHWHARNELEATPRPPAPR